MSRTKRNVVADFDLQGHPGVLRSRSRISKFCLESSSPARWTGSRLFTRSFVNTLTQTPIVRTLLPINPLEIEAVRRLDAATSGGRGRRLFGISLRAQRDDVLGAILPHFVHFQVYQMVLNARASEHSARMVAMKSATDNAKQLIKDLTLEYNKVRQASITTELLEITTAQMALGN